jgi:hypothetical protein
MFVTAQQFDVAPYNIPNLQEDLLTAFNSYVEQEEEKMLRTLLGDMFYEAFIEALNNLPDAWVNNNNPGYGIGAQVTYGVDVWESLTLNNLNNVPEVGANWQLIEAGNRWLKLAVGTKYTVSAKTRTWVGMAEMLKPFIYAQWTETNTDNNTGIGMVVAEAENSSVISPTVRICRAWNEFADMTVDQDFIRYNFLRVTKGNLYDYLYYSADVYVNVINTEYDTTQEYLYHNFIYPGKRNTFGF